MERIKEENCFFSTFNFVQCTQKRKNRMKIQVTIAKKVLVALWHMLTQEQDFSDVYLTGWEGKQSELKALIAAIQARS